jgi:arsenate reductase
MDYYHNPRCSKSRAGLAFFEEHNVHVNTILYLETPATESTLHDIVSKLGIPASDLIRKKDAAKLELTVDDISEEQALKLIADHPSLMERPIAVTETKAVIGRPTEAFEALL